MHELEQDEAHKLYEKDTNDEMETTEKMHDLDKDEAHKLYKDGTHELSGSRLSLSDQSCATELIEAEVHELVDEVSEFAKVMLDNELSDDETHEHREDKGRELVGDMAHEHVWAS